MHFIRIWNVYWSSRWNCAMNENLIRVWQLLWILIDGGSCRVKSSLVSSATLYFPTCVKRWFIAQILTQQLTLWYCFYCSFVAGFYFGIVCDVHKTNLLLLRAILITICEWHINRTKPKNVLVSYVWGCVSSWRTSKYRINIRWNRREGSNGAVSLALTLSLDGISFPFVHFIYFINMTFDIETSRNAILRCFWVKSAWKVYHCFWYFYWNSIYIVFICYFVDGASNCVHSIGLFIRFVSGWGILSMSLFETGTRFHIRKLSKMLNNTNQI